MRKINRVAQWWQQLTSKTAPTYVIDFGSAVTKIVVRPQAGPIRNWSEASCLAWHAPTGTVTSFGDRALKLLGRTPGALSVVFPISRGVVSGQPAAIEYLKAVKLLLGTNTFGTTFLKPRVIGIIPSNISPIAQQLFVQTFEQAGFATDQLVPALVALNRRLQQRYPQHQVRVIIMIGDQLTQLGVFSQQTSVLMKTFDIGGSNYTNQVFQTIRSQYGYEIGWETAELLKQQIGECAVSAPLSGAKAEKSKKMVIRGKSLTDYSVNSLTVAGSSFSEHFEVITAELINEIKDALQEVPAEVLTAALETGIHVSGGGCLLTGLTKRLETELGCAVMCSNHPELDTVATMA